MRPLLARLAALCLVPLAGCGGCGRAGVALLEPPDLGAVVVEREAWTLYVGQRVALRAWGGFVDELPRLLRADEVAWRSEDPAIAEVDGLSLVAKAPGGPVTLVAETESGEARVTVSVADSSPVSLDLAPGDALLAVGESFPLKGLLRFGDGARTDVSRADTGTTWVSADPAALSVSQDGLATALASSPGVVVTATNGRWSGSARVRVTPAPVAIESLVVNPGRTSLSRGNRALFVALARLDDGTEWDVTRDPRTRWSSSSPEAVAVDGEGRATALGTSPFVAISAFFQGHRAAARVVVAEASPVSLRLRPERLALPLGSSARLSLEGTFADGRTEELASHPDVLWTAEDARVQVGPGRVEALGEGGPVRVTASFAGLFASSEVTVGAARVEAWALASGTREVRPGETFDLPMPARLDDGSVRDLASESTGTAYVVEPAGLLSRTAQGRWQAARATGGARVRARNGAAEAVVEVTVRAAPAQVAVLAWEDPAPIVLEEGESLGVKVRSLLVDGRAAEADGVVWFSEAPEVVSVDEAGTLRAIAAGGPVRVTASMAGLSRARLVTVVAAPRAPEKMEIELESRAGVAGERLRARAFATFANGDRADVTRELATRWRISSGDASARVEAPGRIVLVAAGEATVEAELRGVKAAASLVVGAPKLTSLVLSPDALELPPGFVDRVTVLGAYDDGGRRDLAVMASGLLLASSDEGVATVANDGTVRAVAEGAATIEANVGGLRRTLAVRVAPAQVRGLSVNPSAAELPVGRALEIGCLAALPTSRVVDASAPAAGTRCVSSAPDVASVAANVVRARAVGSARVTCLQRGAAAVLSLTVVPAVVEASVAALPSSRVALGALAPVVVAQRMSDGFWADGTGGTRFESSSSAAAFVTSDGVVDARGLGAAALSVTSGEKSTSLVVNVRAPLATALSCRASSVRVGESVPLAAGATWSDGRVGAPGPADGLVWRSADPSVAAVDAAGLARGLRPGAVELFAHLDGLSAACTLEVLP